VSDSQASAYAGLAEALAQDVPVHTLAAPFGGSGRGRTVEGFATALVRSIRSVQPEGPYRLAGCGVGGVVAYEIATQLRGEDQAVEYLGLIDAFHPAELRRMRPSLAPDIRERLDEYEVHPNAVRIHLFTTHARTSPAATQHDGLLGWTACADAAGIALVDLSVKLPSMTTPDVAVLAGALSSSLRTLLPDTRPRRSDRSAVIPIQPGTRDASNPVVFCIPGAGDHVARFVDFVRCLGSDIPVNGLQYDGSDEEGVPFSSVEAAAAAHIRAIDELAPGNEVHLVGHSFGGWIAFQIALELQSARRPASSLTLIDSDAPHAAEPARELTATEVYEYYVRVLELSAEKPLHIDTAEFVHLDRTERHRRLHEAMVRAGLMPRRSPPDVIAGSLRGFGTAVRTTYTPHGVYAGPVHMAFAAPSPLDGALERWKQDALFEQWQQWAPAATRWQGSGNHVTILKPPNADVLAAWWKEHVLRALVHGQR
jgi:thioesterase domain-containing protein